MGFPHSSVVKESACNAGDPGLGRFPWRRKWQVTPVFLPGESHGQRILAGYSSWGFEESELDWSDLACMLWNLNQDFESWQYASKTQQTIWT